MSQRIMMISDHASPIAELGSTDCGGQNVYVAAVSSELAKRGYEVDVFTRRESPDQPDIVQWKKGVRIIHVPAGPPMPVRKEHLLPHMRKFTSVCSEYLRIHSYDLIHANFWLSGMVAMHLKRESHIPFVVTFHALGKVRRMHQAQQDGFPDARFDIEEEIVREADAIIAECSQDSSDLQEYYSAQLGKIVTIPCGVDISIFKPNSKILSRQLLKLPVDRQLLLYAGRLVPRKGLETVVRALAILKRRTSLRPLFVIVGGERSVATESATPEIGRLKVIAEKEGVIEQLKFIGRRGSAELHHFYCASDVFVSTPWYEPFGIAPLEAMASGTPVIGSAVGGIKYTVKAGETGELVPPRNPLRLAVAISKLLQSPQLRKEYSIAALERVRTLFTWSRVVDDLALLYENVAPIPRISHGALMSVMNLLQGTHSSGDRGF
ncbi:MAG: glycosyltransferase [Deltaproteobacteria bacterium]|nr:glycosyltransferase [Deltaproteobacteria bacterium]